MLAALKKVEKMASDNDELEFSALAKCKEFLNLGYPRGILRHMLGWPNLYLYLYLYSFRILIKHTSRFTYESILGRISVP